MYIPDDKDMDRLSRDAAEHYHAPGKPDWNTLRQTLDKELPQEKEKKRPGFFFFFFLILGLSVTGGMVWYGNQINTAEKTVVKQPEKNQLSFKENKIRASNNIVALKDKKDIEKGNRVKPFTDQPTEVTMNGQVSSISAPGPAAKRAVTVKDDAPAGTIVTKLKSRLNLARQPKNTADFAVGEKIAGTDKQRTLYESSVNKKQKNGLPANAGSAGPIVVTVNSNKHANTKNIVVSETAEESGNDIIPGHATAGLQKKDAAESGESNEQAVLSTTPDPANNKVAETKKAVTDTATTSGEKKDGTRTAAKKKSGSKKDKAVNIGLTAGLDVSTVKLTHADNAGYNIGILGGYQFSKHWSVYTGIIYTKKNYKLNGSDYHPPKHYWTQYVKLQSVEGYCHMWELPLMARYTFNTKSKTAYFASTGISSYFMKKAAYNYSYKTNAGVPGYTTWISDSNFNHVFSILHLSAGVEKRFGKRMNWQIEPYAKIPLGGVGFGNIRLSSFGINLSVQYRQPVKR